MKLRTLRLGSEKEREKEEMNRWKKSETKGLSNALSDNLWQKAMGALNKEALYAWKWGETQKPMSRFLSPEEKKWLIGLILKF
ncbi:putative butyrophilin subfamily 3 member A3-like [Sesbania bispinosa]|nr:putative butyrophilin subfamily 3 member A3-like [Sesbania bispinosa]